MPYPTELMDAHDVSPIINSAKYDGPDLYPTCFRRYAWHRAVVPVVTTVKPYHFCLYPLAFMQLSKTYCLLFSASKSGVTLALVQVTVIFVLTLVRAEGLPGGATNVRSWIGHCPIGS
jgi:hypothetical protein